MRRKIIPTLTGTSLFLCIISAWFWVDSVKHISVFIFPTDERDSWHVYVSNWEGRMQFSLNNNKTLLGAGFTRIDPSSFNPKQLVKRGLFWAVDRLALDDEDDYQLFAFATGAGSLTIMLPHALLVIIFAIAPGIWVVRWRHGEKDGGKEKKKKKKKK